MQLSDNKSKNENQNQAHMLHFLAGCSCIPPSPLPPAGSGLPELHGPAQCAKLASSQSCIWGAQAPSTLPALLVAVWGRGELTPGSAACPARAQKQWSVAAQVSEHKGAPHVGLKGPKNCSGSALISERIRFMICGTWVWRQGWEGCPAEPLPFQNGFAAVPGLSRETLTLGEADQVFWECSEDGHMQDQHDFCLQ